MADPTYKLANPTFRQLSKSLHFLIFINILFLLPLCTDAISFNFSSFAVNKSDIMLDWDAKFYGSSIYLTNNPLSGRINRSIGRALYHEAVDLWEVNGNTSTLANFTSNFTFQIFNVSGYEGNGHGFAFLLVPENAKWVPDRDHGKLLGLFESETSAVSSGNQIVAIEFDTHRNKDYREPESDHIGIDVNTIRSQKLVSVSGGLVNRGTTNVRVTYDSTSKNLSASLSFNGSLKYFDVSYIVDLSFVLPQRVRVGFTAATGKFAEVHELYSWSFSSSMERRIVVPKSQPSVMRRNNVGLIVGVTIASVLFILAFGVALFWFRSRRNSKNVQTRENPPHLLQDPVVGPKRFAYVELHEATKGFANELMLGKGGFGNVYEGLFASSNEKVAVKRFKGGSNQGEKEYISEINVFSTLRHKNLVQLKGWCHDNEELLLVYEFLPNRSLDFHLFGNNLPLLTWSRRYNIAVDLANALHYLQDGCDPFVLHRDIKSSNIMLDSSFNAKLGDFGLARLTQQDQNFRTTAPAGTLGYLAPEVISSGKVSKASDIYSYGVVALELASGKRPVNRSKGLNLVEWVWELYGEWSVLEAIDRRLDVGFNEDQARRLVVVGLWCCHPDPESRPSIKQAQAVLNFEAAEPSLPPSMPRATFVSSTDDHHTSLLSGSSTTVSRTDDSSRTTITG